jgi:hypothetical protein
MFETKLNIRQTDQMETEVGIAVFGWSSTCESSSRRSGRDCQHPSKFRVMCGPRLLTSLTTTVFTSAARALAQKNNVRFMDGNDLARLEKRCKLLAAKRQYISSSNSTKPAHKATPAKPRAHPC